MRRACVVPLLEVMLPTFEILGRRERSMHLGFIDVNSMTRQVLAHQRHVESFQHQSK